MSLQWSPGSPAELLDLARYPIVDLDTDSARELTRHCRRQLDQTGACELPGFLTAAATAELTREADALATLAYHSHATGTAYLEVPDFTLPPDHPRRIIGSSSVGVIAYDQFPATSALRRLYEWEPLMAFIGAALAKPRLYRYADPLGALNLAVMGDGEELFWHFDQTDFVTSIALRDAEEGGDFEYAPLIRSAADENYPAVKNLLCGAREGVARIPMCPGTLLLFEGRHSIHRVTPIRGRTTRLVALLAYDTKPGTRSTELLQLARYGRAG
ncbi:MAG TPA: hypothetical protein VL403_13475 [Candidatus Kryptonia bacterium]|nr:hypothetical protein [Candidatus Kryptonia bacterium]